MDEPFDLSVDTFGWDLSTRPHSEACDALDAALPGKLSYPNSTEYALSNSNYWSARQSELKPACLLFPRSAEDVSLALEILAAHDAPFSVKSGGHNAFPAASNIQGGVAISLENLNGTTVSADRRTVSIEPGVRWINVSQTLDPLGLAVVGGRAADVGVSGFILGGGISYLSGQHGWACDNVQNFQVVLASGEIVNANPDENSDLYWALRGGGGSSFGIVTRFDVDAYEQSDLWLRNIIFPEERRDDVIGEFTLVAREVLPLDKDAHNFLVAAYVAELGGFITMTYMYHLTHAQSGAETNPDVYEGYIRLPGSIVDETTVANVSTHLLALNEVYGQRQTWWDTTVSITGGGGAQLLQDIVPEWQEVANSLMAAAKSRNTTLTPYIVYHPLSVNVLEAMQKKGGNALGLDPESGPLVLVHVRVTWTDPALDELIESSVESLIGGIETMAESRGLGNGFKYMNYAGKTQDVLGSYGEENLQRLRTVAEKYDPNGQLQSLWNGYFQVG